MSAPPAGPDRGWLGPALALGLAAAVSLGLARFAYALLLPAMRADLGWSYATAGAMNTANAAGYLLGALLMPQAFRRLDARRVVLAGGLASAVLLALHGAVRSDLALYGLRLAAGAASAASFVGGGLLAARLAASPAGASRSGLVLGLYYGGTGVGIVAASLAVPPLLAQADAGWPTAWWLLGVLALAATLGTAAGTRRMAAPPAAPAGGGGGVAVVRPLAWGMAGYLLFGLGYIGYMTFIVTLLREQGHGGAAITAFYALLGACVCASSWLWAGLLQRHRDGRPLALLNGLLALATALPVLVPGAWAAFASGLLFGSVFLSVVASTTALVRHNLPPPQWPAGIAAFTILFAAGQIVGPLGTGWLSDLTGGLRAGFLASAGLLALGCGFALRQRALAAAAPPGSA